MHAFEMMPVVGRHEEQTAVLRIVVAVGTHRVLRLHRGAVGAGAGIRLLDLRMIRARERQLHGQLHELAAADRTFAGSLLLDDGVDWTAVHRIQADRIELHLADRAGSFLVVEHVRVHRTGVRERRKSGCGLTQARQEQPGEDHPCCAHRSSLSHNVCDLIIETAGHERCEVMRIATIHRISKIWYSPLSDHFVEGDHEHVGASSKPSAGRRPCTRCRGRRGCRERRERRSGATGSESGYFHQERRADSSAALPGMPSI